MATLMSAGEFWSHPLVVSVTAAAITSAGAGVVVAIRLMLQLKAILVGPDGQNDLRSEVRRALAGVEELHAGIADLTHRVERVEDSHRLRPTPRRRTSND